MEAGSGVMAAVFALGEKNQRTAAKAARTGPGATARTRRKTGGRGGFSRASPTAAKGKMFIVKDSSLQTGKADYSAFRRLRRNRGKIAKGELLRFVSGKSGIHGENSAAAAFLFSGKDWRERFNPRRAAIFFRRRFRRRR